MCMLSVSVYHRSQVDVVAMLRAPLEGPGHLDNGSAGWKPEGTHRRSACNLDHLSLLIRRRVVQHNGVELKGGGVMSVQYVVPLGCLL